MFEICDGDNGQNMAFSYSVGAGSGYVLLDTVTGEASIVASAEGYEFNWAAKHLVRALERDFMTSDMHSSGIIIWH